MFLIVVGILGGALGTKGGGAEVLGRDLAIGGGCFTGGDLEIGGGTEVLGGDLVMGGGCFTGGGGGFSTLVGSTDLETDDSRLVLNSANRPDRLRVLVVS